MIDIKNSKADLIILGGDLNAMPNDARGKKLLSTITISSSSTKWEYTI